MQLEELKDYIRSHNCIETILKEVGCHTFSERQKEVRCAKPSSSNATSISVNKETLKTRMYTAEETVSGDIFTLIMYFRKCSFPQSLKFVHSILGLKFTYEKIDEEQKPKSIALEFFKAAEKNAKANKISEPELKLYDDSILHNYIMEPNIWFLREGILPHTQDKFRIGYCPEKNRVAIPIRLWNGINDEYIGVFGRTTLEDWESIGISKYMPLVPYPKSMNLYGLHENYADIIKTGQVVVFESEKSVLKADTMKIFNTVAVGSHELSHEHISILISLDVDIVIAYDKDIQEEFVIETCKRFKAMRNVSYIIDTDNLLGEKDAPIDRGMDVYFQLLEHRKQVYLTK